MLSHGTRESVELHHQLDEPLCPRCESYLRDLATEGWAPPSWSDMNARQRRRAARRESLGEDPRS